MKSFIIIILISIPVLGQSDATKLPLSLEQAVQAALANNPGISRAIKTVAAAKGKFWNSISLPQPELSLSHEFVPTGRPLSEFQEKTLEISQSMEFPTNIYFKGSRSNLEIKSSEIDYERSIIEVSSIVRKLYSQALIKEKELALTEDNLKIAKDFLDKAEIRQKAGEGTKLESITAKMQYNESAVNVEAAKKELGNSINDLLAYINSAGFAGRTIVLTDSLVFPESEIRYEDILKEAYRNNHLLRKSVNSVEIASINKTLAWSSILPNLEFSYMKQSVPGNNDFYGFSFGVSLPVWFLFDQRGQIQEAAANYSIAEDELKSGKNSLELNVKSAYSEFVYSAKQLSLYKEQLMPQAGEVFKLAKASYDSGEINYVEFLQAKQNLISIRINYYNALSNYYSSLSSLEILTGKLITNNIKEM